MPEATASAAPASAPANAPTSPPGALPRLRLAGITKRYPAVLANNSISLEVAPGEIHAVLGENGAGKSTLMKVIMGAVQPDAGSIEVDGQRVHMASPAHARRLGLAMVHQHFSLFESLTVAENIALGQEGGESLPALSARLLQVAQRYGLPLEPQRPVFSLSVGERQRVEIVRALLTQPQLLILDEPTSVLTPQAVQSLFATLRQLAAEGTSIVYISHKLEEIRSLCQACTVLRAASVVARLDPRRSSAAELSRLMIGQSVASVAASQATVADAASAADAAGAAGAATGASTSTPARLVVRDLNLPADATHGAALQGIGFEVAQGEILGVAGVSGNGQHALFAVLSGEDCRARAGSIELEGQAIAQWPPQRRREAGLRCIAEDRLGRAAVPSLSLAANTWLTHQGARGPQWPNSSHTQASVSPSGWLRPSAARVLAAGFIAAFKVKAPGPQALAQSLSGGNLQKFLVARELHAQPQVLVVAQPTWGVDVGAAARIHQALLALRDAGCAIVLISEELDELFALSNRLVVMAQGQLSPALATASATREQVGLWMAGLWPNGPGNSQAHSAHAAPGTPGAQA